MKRTLKSLPGLRQGMWYNSTLSEQRHWVLFWMYKSVIPVQIHGRPWNIYDTGRDYIPMICFCISLSLTKLKSSSHVSTSPNLTENSLRPQRTVSYLSCYLIKCKLHNDRLHTEKVCAEWINELIYEWMNLLSQHLAECLVYSRCGKNGYIQHSKHVSIYTSLPSMLLLLRSTTGLYV